VDDVYFAERLSRFADRREEAETTIGKFRGTLRSGVRIVWLTLK
jgi:hypothetical protein